MSFLTSYRPNFCSECGEKIVRLRLGASLCAAKDYAAAASQFEVVAGNDKSPHRAQALYRAGECLYAAGEFARAAEKLAVFRDKGEFHAVGGVSDRAVLRLGQALARANEWDRSRQAFEVFLQRYGNSPFAADPRLGISRISENAIPTDCTQSGSAVYRRWCGPAHMYTEISAQKLTTEKR